MSKTGASVGEEKEKKFPPVPRILVEHKQIRFVDVEEWKTRAGEVNLCLGNSTLLFFHENFSITCWLVYTKLRKKALAVLT